MRLLSEVLADKGKTKALIAAGPVVVRVDFNVPLEEVKAGSWRVKDDERILNAKETVDALVGQGARVVLLSHLGRPEGNGIEEKYSLKPVFEYLQEKNWWPIKFSQEIVGKEAEKTVGELGEGEVLLMENVRFDKREKKNDDELVAAMARLGKNFVNEAFASSHRRHASVYGLAQALPSYAGLALEKEVAALSTLIDRPAKPLVVVVGGAKISDKVAAINNLAQKADIVLIGGGVANNFIKAEGVEICESYLQDTPADLAKEGVNYVDMAGKIIADNKTERFLKDDYIPLTKIMYPFDVVAANPEKKQNTQIIDLSTGMKDRPDYCPLSYFDIGPKTTRLYQEIILSAGTVFWNGPMGMFEEPQFAKGTSEIARAVAKTSAYTVIGGGDTIAAVASCGYEGRVDFASTGGSASLEFLAGEILPGIEILEEK